MTVKPQPATRPRRTRQAPARPASQRREARPRLAPAARRRKRTHTEGMRPAKAPPQTAGPGATLVLRLQCVLSGKNGYLAIFNELSGLATGALMERGIHETVHTLETALIHEGRLTSQEGPGTGRRRRRPGGLRPSATARGGQRLREAPPTPQHPHWAASCDAKFRRPEGGGTSWLASQFRARRKCLLQKG